MCECEYCTSLSSPSPTSKRINQARHGLLAIYLCHDSVEHLNSIEPMPCMLAVNNACASYVGVCIYHVHMLRGSDASDPESINLFVVVCVVVADERRTRETTIVYYNVCVYVYTVIKLPNGVRECTICVVFGFGASGRGQCDILQMFTTTIRVMDIR